jgi:hypothetical protein
MTAPEKLSAFVLMPFDARFDDVYRLGVKAAVEELGMEATRVDEQRLAPTASDGWARTVGPRPVAGCVCQNGSAPESTAGCTS